MEASAVPRGGAGGLEKRGPASERSGRGRAVQRVKPPPLTLRITQDGGPPLKK